MAFRYSTNLFDEFLTTLRTELANGVINFYSGSQPATADAAITGTLIGQTSVGAGAWTPGSPTNGLNFDAVVAESASISKAAAEEWKFDVDNAGTIGWGRFISNSVSDSGGELKTVARIDFSVGITSGDCRMSKVTYATGETGIVQSFTIPLSNIS